MPPSDFQTRRDRFVWNQDEFDEALELGEQLLYKLTTSGGEEVDVGRLEQGGRRVTIKAGATRVELTLSAGEADALVRALQRSESPVEGPSPGQSPE